MSRVRTILFLIVAIMLVVLGVGLFKFQQAKKDPAGLVEVLPDNADLSLNEIHQTSTRDGVKEWSLDADSVRFQKKEGRSVLKNVAVTFYLRDAETVHVTGREGLFLSDTKDMEILGGVVVKSGLYTLKTEKLTYHHGKRSIETDVPVVIEGNGVFLSGHSMVFTFADRQVVMGGGIEAKVEDRFVY